MDSSSLSIRDIERNWKSMYELNKLSLSREMGVPYPSISAIINKLLYMPEFNIFKLMAFIRINDINDYENSHIFEVSDSKRSFYIKALSYNMAAVLFNILNGFVYSDASYKQYGDQFKTDNMLEMLLHIQKYPVDIVVVKRTHIYNEIIWEYSSVVKILQDILIIPHAPRISTSRSPQRESRQRSSRSKSPQRLVFRQRSRDRDRNGTTPERPLEKDIPTRPYTPEKEPTSGPPTEAHTPTQEFYRK